MNSRWIDISVPLSQGMIHWPDNPPLRLKRILDMDHGDHCTVSRLSMGSHTGTHMDAPLHFIRHARGIDRMPLAATIGPARVVEIHNPQSITVKELRSHRIRRGERILFRTKNSISSWEKKPFQKEFVYLSTEAAQFLAAIRIKALGVDYLSVGGYKKNGQEVHTLLLKAGVWIIEGLDLSKVRPGHYELICLPLKVEEGDGAPARAVLKRGR